MSEVSTQPEGCVDTSLTETAETAGLPEPNAVVDDVTTKTKRTLKRQGKKVVVTFVDKNLHKQLKLLSIDKEMSMEDIARAALALYLEMHQRKSV